MKNIILMAIILIAASACKKAPDKFEDELASPDIAALHLQAVARVETQFLDQGWVVSLSPDGNARHQGDSLIWSGLYLSAVTCDQAALTESTLQKAILDHHGELWRHWSIDDASIDGAIGMFRGIAERLKRKCPNVGEWIFPLDALDTYAKAHNGSINHNSSAGLDAFGFILDVLLDRVSASPVGDYDPRRRDVLVQAVAGWAQAVRIGYDFWKAGVQKDPPAAFRVHLGLQVLETLEALNIEIPPNARDKFCQATDGMDLPTTDHWCGRAHIRDWINVFKYDEWEYRHQRAGAWEQPDGNGLRTPGIDLLKGIAQGFKI